MILVTMLSMLAHLASSQIFPLHLMGDTTVYSASDEIDIARNSIFTSVVQHWNPDEPKVFAGGFI